MWGVVVGVGSGVPPCREWWDRNDVLCLVQLLQWGQTLVLLHYCQSPSSLRQPYIRAITWIPSAEVTIYLTFWWRIMSILVTIIIEMRDSRKPPLNWSYHEMPTKAAERFVKSLYPSHWSKMPIILVRCLSFTLKSDETKWNQTLSVSEVGHYEEA